MKRKYSLNRRHVKNVLQPRDQTLDHFLFANNCANNANGAKIGAARAQMLSDTTASLSSPSSKLQCRRAKWEIALSIDQWSSEIVAINNLLVYLRRKGASESTRKTYCSHLCRIFKFLGVTAEELIKMSKEKREEYLNKYVINLIEKGRSLKYIKSSVDALKAFFRANNEKIDVTAPRLPPRYRKKGEYIPTPSEAIEMANAARTLRDKAMILLMAFSGLRVSTLLALRYKDVKEELEKGFENICIEVYPSMKEVVADACKSNIPYYTFTVKKATDILKRYIEERKKMFGEINDDEPLFCTSYNQIDKNARRFRPLRRDTVEKIVKNAARHAGINRWKDVTPHTLRKTFQTFLRSQPSSIRLDLRDQEFLFGHILGGSMDFYYDMSRKEDLRQKFSKMIIENKPASCIQKLINPEEVEKYLADGWKVITFVPGLNKVVVEKTG